MFSLNTIRFSTVCVAPRAKCFYEWFHKLLFLAHFFFLSKSACTAPPAGHIVHNPYWSCSFTLLDALFELDLVIHQALLYFSKSPCYFLLTGASRRTRSHGFSWDDGTRLSSAYIHTATVWRRNAFLICAFQHIRVSEGQTETEGSQEPKVKK